MAVKSVFDIKCFKDVKFWVEQSVLQLRYIEIRKHFLKYHSPHVPVKAFACTSVTIFYTLYGSGLLAQGGGGGKTISSPKTQGLSP